MRTLTRSIIALSLSAQFLASGALLSAQEKSAAEKGAVTDKAVKIEKTDASKEGYETDARSQREADAWGFVMRHHPQLGEVLSRLKLMNPLQYERAINQVALASERIIRQTKNDPKRGEMELQDWRFDSQIKLLAARTMLAAKNDETSKKEIGEIVRKQLENRLRIAEYERDRALNRAKLLDEQATKLRENLDRDVDARLADLQREVIKTRKTLQTEAPKQPLKPKTATGAE